MKTDSLFYRLLQAEATLAFELAGLAVPEPGRYGFISQTINQTAFRFFHYKRRIEIWSSICFVLALLVGVKSHGADNAPPILRINDHFAAPIWRINVDAEERHLVAGSADKAVIVWTLDEWKKPVIHRVPPRPEEDQRAHPTAISPDGAIVAYGVPPLRDTNGWPIPNTSKIYILDTYKGKILKEIEGISNRPQDLRFSPDGHYLAAAISDGCGVRVWRTSDWKIFGQDDSGYGGPSDETGSICINTPPKKRDKLPDTLSLLFPESGDVWLITSGATGIRTYRKTNTGLTRIIHRSSKELGVELPDGIAISPDGRNLAVGDRRIRGKQEIVRLRIVILDLATLKQSKVLEIKDDDLDFPDSMDPTQYPDADQFNLTRVVWGNVGGEEWVFASGFFPCKAARKQLIFGNEENGFREICSVAWSLNGADPKIRFFPVGSDQVMDLAFLKHKQWFIVASHKRIAAIDLQGNFQAIPTKSIADGDEKAKHRFLFENRAADFRDYGAEESPFQDFLISDDAKTVYFEDYRSTSSKPMRLRFDLKELKLASLDKQPDGLKAPDHDEVLLEPYRQWSNGPRPPEIYKRPLKALDGVTDRFRTATLARDKQAILVSDNFVRVIDYRKGEPRIRCERRIAAEGFRVNVTPDGRIIVVGHGDGTLRWYRVTEREGGEDCALEHLLSVYLRESEDSHGQWTWVAWRPGTGEFAMAPKAEGLLAWQLTERNCQTRTVPFGELTLDFYDKEAVKTALDEPQATQKQAQRLAQVTAAYCDPITFRVDVPDKPMQVDTEIVKFKLDLSGNGVWPRNLLATYGETTRIARRYAGRTYQPDEPIALTGPGKVELEVELPPDARMRHGDVHVCFHLDISRYCHPIVWNGPLAKAEKRRLWAVLVGISNYGNGLNRRVPDLMYAQNDAIDVAKLFINDYRKRVEARKTGEMPTSSNHTPAANATQKILAADYDEIHIDLFVSPTPLSDAQDELKEIGALPYVALHETNAQDLIKAIARIAEKIPKQGLSNDLFVFYFSGHGLANPVGTSKGYSIFLMPPTEEDEDIQKMATHALNSGDLLDLFGQITADKLIVFDACRNVAMDPNATPFEPGKMRSEFQKNALDAHLFFSADVGQKSIEDRKYTFDESRRKRFQGNGKFTYYFLKSLTDSEADFPSQVYALGKIEVEEISAYLLDKFFKDEKKPIQQEPIYIPARSGTKMVVRSLDQKTAQQEISKRAQIQNLIKSFFMLH